DDDRVVRPVRDQPDCQWRGPSLDVYQMRLLENQFVSAPRLFVFDLLEGEIADLAYSGAHPERESEGVAGVKRAGVAEAQHSLAVKRRGAADHADAERRIAVQRSPAPIMPRRIAQPAVKFVMRRDLFDRSDGHSPGQRLLPLLLQGRDVLVREGVGQILN